jgi:hypothetical protein
LIPKRRKSTKRTEETEKNTRPRKYITHSDRKRVKRKKHARSKNKKRRCTKKEGF